MNFWSLFLIYFAPWDQNYQDTFIISAKLLMPKKVYKPDSLAQSDL